MCEEVEEQEKQGRKGGTSAPELPKTCYASFHVVIILRRLGLYNNPSSHPCVCVCTQAYHIEWLSDLAMGTPNVQETVPLLRIFSNFPFPQVSSLPHFLHPHPYRCQGLSLFPETDELLQVGVLLNAWQRFGVISISRDVSIRESSQNSCSTKNNGSWKV